MADPLTGRLAVVTGASRGIGRALAVHLAARGMRVVAAARSAEELSALASEADGAVAPVVTDVTDPASIRRLAEAARRLGRIEAVINNAGVGYLEPFLDSDERHWREIVDTNLFGALQVARAFLPDMLAAGQGVVVNVGSSGANGWPYLALYGASKAALQAASVALDREFAGRGVRVLSVEVNNTSGTRFAAGFDPQLFEFATGRWAELGIIENMTVATPEESAQTIAEAIETALNQEPV